MTNMRTCVRCGDTKPLGEWHPSKSHLGTHPCRACWNTQMREYQRRQPFRMDRYLVKLGQAQDRMLHAAGFSPTLITTAAMSVAANEGGPRA